MWLLESNGDFLEGKKLWLRPGRQYLFGRTRSGEPEPGQQIILNHNTISRKHMTVRISEIPEGGALNVSGRSEVELEDLKSKKGTLVNGKQIRGERLALTKDENEITLGTCGQVFRISWFPVVLSFSFSTRDLKADPWSRLRESLEQLDIKLSESYEAVTSHIVAKKRNTPKGLQGLINGKYIVTDGFIKAIEAAAAVPGDAPPDTVSALEANFDGNWPNPMEYLPPRGDEPSTQSDDSFAPDERRQEVFKGYTFVFYDKGQHETLLQAITSGSGKALLYDVKPGETSVDDFVRYVKSVAGEKGLGSFEDGSEGRGVVIVRFTPKDATFGEWFREFFTGFATRLVHRPILQTEFLGAILVCDASMLRCPLQPMSQQTSAQAALGDSADRMDIDRTGEGQEQEEAPEPAPARRSRRRAGGRRFKGIDVDSDGDENTTQPPVLNPEPAEEPQQLETTAASQAAASQDSLFVSQNPHGRDETPSLDSEMAEPRRLQRKRAFSPIREEDAMAVLDEIAPSKRRRVGDREASVEIPESPEPDNTDVNAAAQKPAKAKPKAGAKGRSKKAAADDDGIQERVRLRRAEEEARAAAERHALEDLPTDEIDYAAIRQLHIIEECEVHFPDPDRDTQRRDPVEEPDADRWDSQWNGRRNFKRFRKQGEAAGRAPPRIMLALEEVSNKEYGIGDGYWLDDDAGRRKKGGGSQSQAAVAGRKTRRARPRIDSDDEGDSVQTHDVDNPLQSDGHVDEDGEGVVEEPSASRTISATSTRRSQRRGEKSQTSTASGKRAAEAPPAREKPAKKPRKAAPSDEDSDDGLKFRIGRRR